MNYFREAILFVPKHTDIPFTFQIMLDLIAWTVMLSLTLASSNSEPACPAPWLDASQVGFVVIFSDLIVSFERFDRFF